MLYGGVINNNNNVGTLTSGGENNEQTSSFVNVAVKLTVLNTDLVGVFNKSTEEVGEGNNRKKIVKSEILVMPTDSPKGGMSIMELIDGVNKMIEDFSGKKEDQVKESDVTEKINMVSKGGVLNKIKVELRQIFLYRKQEDTYARQGEAYSDTPASSDKKFEYAINFIITSEITNNTVFRIDSVSLAFWNTSRPKITDRMQLGDINRLLNG